VWALDAKRQLSRLLLDDSMVKSAEERRDFWVMLRELAGREKAEAESEGQLESRVRQEVVQKIASRLMGLVSGDQPLDLGAALGAGDVAVADSGGPTPERPAETPPASSGDYMAPWIDTEECTACDECIIINPQLFAYNDDKKAYIKSPEAGPYRDLVKAAEKCTAEVIHPGLPRDPAAKDMDKWIKRAEKFN
jgi:pyruvate-ferredoxin/flavodoxin oxidoreductase